MSERKTHYYSDEPRDGTSPARQIKRGLWILALILVLVFVVQNAKAVEVHYLFWNFRLSLGLLVIVILLVGAGLGWALTTLMWHAHHKRHKR